ncbi:Diphthine--ammonia ligase [Meyerozyma sp. JA9]|nr:Diphthine--ammonia ligase [Meyerozyma sp. JA9]
MKFVALISGGKDSFFNIQHCIAQGHELVAVANLYPQENLDEIDSFMFQTVGHNVINHYGECLGVPVYRQAIHGGSKNQELEYSVTEDDEIEDLYLLLQKVCAHHDIQGVSCGAILSSYQRTRVENVCGRLGLTSLAYLWQRDQLELMTEMSNSGLDARLIKVAAIGLTASDLGKSITQMLPKLVKLNQMYEVHICGEGGEFETLVFDSPLFQHKRLEIATQEIVTDTRNDVSYLRLQVKVVPKEPVSLDTVQPPVLDGLFSSLEHSTPQPQQDNSDNSVIPTTTLPTSVKRVNGYLFVSNLTSNFEGVEECMNSIFAELHKILKENRLDFGSIQHIELLVSNMDTFNSINKVYSEVFSSYFLPPSRVCVETAVPTPVSLSCTALLLRPKRQGIHIRSVSYWAPHNIGPYSQSIVDESETYKLATISGQIPLVPATMTLSSTSDNSLSSYLCMQHFHRVKELVQVKEIGAAVCFVTDPTLAQVATTSWKSYIQEVEQGQGLQSLVTVQVTGLPKAADVELSGFTFEVKSRHEEDSEDEDNQEDKFEAAGPRFLFEKYHTQAIGDMTSTVFFTNDANHLQDLPGQVQLYTTTELQVASGVQIVPVSNVWDTTGSRYRYGGIIKTWKTT